MRVVSLFAGIGGFDLGFERAGFEIVAHVEKDAHCRKKLATRWPNAVTLDDVCTAGAHNIPPCDVITFGFPCQDLSVAGKRAGLKGKRSGLFYEATRIIRELQPAWALFENVPGLLSSEGGADFAAVLAEMGERGYHGAWRVLDAQWFGVAQRRRRVFGLFTRLDSGAQRCAEILSIPENLRGNPAPCREAGQRVAGSLESRVDGGGFPGTDGACAGHVVSCPITGNPYGDHESRESLLIPAAAGCLAAGAHPGSYNGQDAHNDMLIPQICGALTAKGPTANGAPEVDGNHYMPVAFGGDVARTLNARHDSSPCADRGMDVVAVPVTMRESGQGFWMEDDKAGTLRAEGENRPSRPSNVVAQVQWASGGGKVHNPTAQALRSGAEHNYQFAQLGMQVRRLTPTECERLQGFPDGHTAGFSDSTRYKMLGNAVCVNVAEWIAKRLMENIRTTTHEHRSVT
jgi:DNA (cytosine-5)-methyltransferase 1